MFDEFGFRYPKDAKYRIELDLGMPLRESLESPIECGFFLYYGCPNCGYKFEDKKGKRLYYPFGSLCPKCHKKTVESICLGNPHIHRRYYVFQLHILDLKVRDLLGYFLGADSDSMLGFSCKGSWHNFRNDSSGFDICHKNCLDELIMLRKHTNKTGIELFKHKFSELGVVFTGNYNSITAWKDGRTLSDSEFDLVKTEYENRKKRDSYTSFCKVLDAVIT